MNVKTAIIKIQFFGINSTSVRELLNPNSKFSTKQSDFAMDYLQMKKKEENIPISVCFILGKLETSL